jgi:hypothetical protein
MAGHADDHMHYFESQTRSKRMPETFFYRKLVHKSHRREIGHGFMELLQPWTTLSALVMLIAMCSCDGDVDYEGSFEVCMQQYERVCMHGCLCSWVYMYVCMCIWNRMDMYGCICMYACAYGIGWICMGVYAYTCVCMHVCVHMCVYACMRTHVCVCIHMGVYAYTWCVCMYAYTCVYMRIHVCVCMYNCTY